MAIFNTKQITEGGKTFNRLTSPNLFWGVGYNQNLEIVIMTIPDESEPDSGALSANSVADGIWNGFGADTFEELVQEIENKGLIYP